MALTLRQDSLRFSPNKVQLQYSTSRVRTWLLNYLSSFTYTAGYTLLTPLPLLSCIY